MWASPQKAISRSKAQFEENGTSIVLDVFQHSEQEYIQSAEKAGFNLLVKDDWYDNQKDVPRLISLLFEKPK